MLLCQARYRLGARPVVALFRRLCRPLATPATPGAFLFGLRLLALTAATSTCPIPRQTNGPSDAARRRAGGAPGRRRWSCCWSRAAPAPSATPGFGRRLLRSTGPGTLVL